MRFFRHVLVTLLCIAVAPTFAQAAVDDIWQPSITGGRLGPAYLPLIDELRKGGHVLLFRHDRTIVSGRWDFEAHVPGACERERNLSAAGRASARAIGRAIDQLDITVGRVVSSTYCRSVDSARLMFGGVHLQTSALIGADGKERTFDVVRQDVVDLVSEEMPATGVLILVGHHGTIDAFTSAMLDEGDALILERQEGGALDVKAHMPAARWEEIARDLDRFEVQQLFMTR